MVPFRPTVDRVWTAAGILRYDRLDVNRYSVVMHPEMLWDLRTHPLVARQLLWSTRVDMERIFGIPVEVDTSMRRGAIVLRHQIEA